MAIWPRGVTLRGNGEGDMKLYLRDARLWLFILLAGGASILSSHGAFQFFKYLVSDELAAVFILVVALGIIGLDAAGTLEKGWRSFAYYAGMAFFLVLETLANYFAGQAGFAAQIVAKLPPTSDLRTIAEQSPVATRMLVILFLSLASLAVALFTFAATARFQQLRAGVDSSLRARFARLFTQRRALVLRLVRELRHVRTDARELRARFEHFHTEAERLRAECDQVRAMEGTVRGELEAVRAEFAQSSRTSNQTAAELAAVRAEFAQASKDLETVRSESARSGAQLATVRASEETIRAEADRLRRANAAADQVATAARAELVTVRADLDEARTLAQLDAQAIARSLAGDGVSMKAIGRALGISDKTAAKWAAEKVEA